MPTPPFPYVSVLDAFNRANEGPPPSASWGTMIGTGLTVSTNEVAAAGGDSMGHWSASTFGPDCEGYITFGTLSGSNNRFRGIALRVSNPGATYNGYVYGATKVATADEHQITRIDAGVSTVLGATVTQEYAAGDSFGFRVVGTTLTGYYKSGAGAWTELLSRTDSTYTAAGYIGLYIGSTTDRGDNFGAGSVFGSSQSLLLGT